MNKTFSIYMDLIRFSAAFLVFFYHLAFPNFFYLLPWVDVGHQAVVVFFVLSGYVIAFVCETKNPDLKSYALSRFSRLYSVVIPALLITFTCYYLGKGINPEIYKGYHGEYTIYQDIFYFIINSLYLNQIWFYQIPSFSNTPYWSMGYEFWYYVIFGIWFYLRGKSRTILIITALFLVGPKIILLFPVWLLGVWAYSFNKKSNISRNHGWVLFLSPIIVFFIYYFSELRPLSKLLAADNLGIIIPLGWSKYFLLDYIVGALVACNIIGFFKICEDFSDLLAKYEKPIRWLASYTFSLYLFHFPLLHFFVAILDHDPKSVIDGLILSVLVLVSVVLLGRFSEHKKHVAEKAIQRLTALGKSKGLPT